MFETLLAFLLTIPDLILKSRIEELPDTFFPHPAKRVPLTLERHHNYGFCLNRLQEHPKAVCSAVVGIYGIFFGLALRFPFRSGNRSERLGTILMLSGGLSNLVDRITRGYVVDYLHFRVPGLKRVIMNVGDIFLFLGSAIISVSTLRDMINPRNSIHD